MKPSRLVSHSLTPRDGCLLCGLVLQDTVETVMGILGMHPCEGTEAVPPHARSHTVLLAGQFPGDERALVRCATVAVAV